MAKVFMSFLGLGAKNLKTSKYEYTPSYYSLNGKESCKTPFVQIAELELLKPVIFDRIIIVTTQAAADTHFSLLRQSLREIGYPDANLLILSEDMSTQGQWRWFEQILSEIQESDELTVDLTHGYRSIPIIFSTAVNFLQRARNIQLEHVFYGAFEKNREKAPIVDMKDFYSINIWADAVERLVEDADARKIAELSANVPEYQISQINDTALIEALSDLTNRIRNVDINNVHQSAFWVVNFIIQKKPDSSPVEKLLFNLLLNKYVELAGSKPLSGRYDKQYFEIQLELIKLFNEHKLYMQSFTAMREFIGSIGLIGIDKSKFDNSAGRKLRKKFSEIFINMYQHPEEKWNFFDKHEGDDQGKEKHARELLPFYKRLQEIGIEPLLRDFIPEMTKFRNSLDHAWTEQSGFSNQVIEKAPDYYKKLQQVIEALVEHHILG